jgi:hypothetical protein
LAGQRRAFSIITGCELANYLADFLAIYLAILGELFGNLVAGGQNSDYRRV